RGLADRLVAERVVGIEVAADRVESEIVIGGMGDGHAAGDAGHVFSELAVFSCCENFSANSIWSLFAAVVWALISATSIGYIATPYPAAFLATVSISYAVFCLKKKMMACKSI